MSKSTPATLKVATPAPVKSTPNPIGKTCGTGTATSGVPLEKIAQRAYEKWLNRGCSHGSDVQDWHEAEEELKVEMKRLANSSAPKR